MPKVVVKSGAVVELVLGTSSAAKVGSNFSWQRTLVTAKIEGTGARVSCWDHQLQDFWWAPKMEPGTRLVGELFKKKYKNNMPVDGMNCINMKSNTATHLIRVYITIWLRQNTTLYPSSHNHGSEKWVPLIVVTLQIQTCSTEPRLWEKVTPLNGCQPPTPQKYYPNQVSVAFEDKTTSL